MKKLLAGLGMAAMALGMTGIAGAASISKISDDSFGLSTSVKSILAKLQNNNKLGLLNAVSSSGNSGKNTFVSADDQTGSMANTGAASAATLVDSTGNANSVSEDYQSSGGNQDTISEVSDTSTGSATTTDTLTNDVVNNNDTEVTNSVGGEADSGANAALSGDSLSASSFTTGKSDAAVGVQQKFNINMKTIMHRIVWHL